ncbi:hypothetical protein AX774_g7065 [Zancudomyces culisetae]|uniref:Uncharacterized protein n=1 Tax=Zancudomyces culisetae TaxID=1213189 RepID=A0A1R1PEY6_ZANCU|nr:hypothetical protein AX774_g7065 [Zancudomyces culisetae]|eukprot:OMH79521.1 hypothetical protein AX774_g7065 [Zancudomyces culisetae]
MGSCCSSMDEPEPSRPRAEASSKKNTPKAGATNNAFGKKGKTLNDSTLSSDEKYELSTIKNSDSNPNGGDDDDKRKRMAEAAEKRIQQVCTFLLL